MFKAISNIFNTHKSNNSQNYEGWFCEGGIDGKPEHQFNPTLMSYHDRVCTYCGAARPKPQTKPNESDNSSIKKSEPILFYTLSIFNIVSGWTTIQGANQILPIVGIPTGISIQLMLFLLVSGSAGKNLPKTAKWAAIGIFTILSVYTSFFSFYGSLGSRDDKNNELIRAKDAHKEMLQDLYAPLELRVKSLPGLIADKEKQIKDEEAGRGSTRQSKCRDECKKLINQKIELNTKFSDYKSKLDNLKPFFEYDINSKANAQEILDLDLLALGKLPSNWLDIQASELSNKIPAERLEKYRNKEKFKDNYLDPDRQIELLAPYNKIVKGEGRAIMAGSFALMLDGTIIMLGAALDHRRKKEVKIKSSKLGSELIDDLRQSIKNNQIEIDKSKYIAGEGIYLLDVMKDCGWIKSSTTESLEIWSIIPGKEKELFNWLNTERLRHINQETSGKQKRNKSGYLTFIFPDNSN
jgi:hypothetical protein